jgi:hypothetical protein
LIREDWDTDEASTMDRIGEIGAGALPG